MHDSSNLTQAVDSGVILDKYDHCLLRSPHSRILLAVSGCFPCQILDLISITLSLLYHLGLVPLLKKKLIFFFKVMKASYF